MSATGTSMDTGANGSAVAKNYAFILVGGIVFPFMIVAHFIARKRRDQPVGLEQSHYAFQYRTTSLALIGLAAVSLITVAMFVGMPSQTLVQHSQQKVRFILVSNVTWFIMLWVAIRCIRGLFLSAARRAIQYPKRLWPWPQ